MPNLILRWCVLAALSMVTLAACSSGRSDAVKPEPENASAKPARPDAGAPCQPLTCLSDGGRCGQVSDGCGGVIDCGRCSRCGPQEMDCCGTCIPRSEKRCPDNVHCPTAPPEM